VLDSLSFAGHVSMYAIQRSCGDIRARAYVSAYDSESALVRDHSWVVHARTKMHGDERWTEMHQLGHLKC